MLNAIAALLAVSAAGALDEGDFWTGVSRSTDERLNRTRELARRGYKEAGQGSSELSISADRGRAGGFVQGQDRRRVPATGPCKRPPTEPVAARQ